MATQVEIAEKLGLDVSSVNKILNRCRGPVFRQETIEKVFRTAQEMGYDFGRIKFRHRRKHSRRSVKMSAEISVYNVDGTLHDQGLATIQDISAGGARITDLSLPMGTLPVDPFTLSIRPLRKSLKSLEIQGKIVRIVQKDGVAFGVLFDGLDADARRRLQKISSN